MRCVMAASTDFPFCECRPCAVRNLEAGCERDKQSRTLQWSTRCQCRHHDARWKLPSTQDKERTFRPNEPDPLACPAGDLRAACSHARPPFVPATCYLRHPGQAIPRLSHTLDVYAQHPRTVLEPNPHNVLASFERARQTPVVGQRLSLRRGWQLRLENEAGPSSRVQACRTQAARARATS